MTSKKEAPNKSNIDLLLPCPCSRSPSYLPKSVILSILGSDIEIVYIRSLLLSPKGSHSFSYQTSSTWNETILKHDMIMRLVLVIMESF
ncbi:unnamed protein product [Cochlearia groenlandica]